MKTRRLASLALLTTVMLGATGCTFITPQATLIQYNPADGVGFNVGELEVRDALIVADEDGTVGNFAGAVINSSDKAHTLSLEYGPVGNSVTERVLVPAGTTLTLGHDDVEPLFLVDIDTPPGAMLDVQFSTGDDSTLQMVPVLEALLPQYEHLEPKVRR